MKMASSENKRRERKAWQQQAAAASWRNDINKHQWRNRRNQQSIKHGVALANI